MNTLENNKLIAEFMEWKKIDNYYNSIAFNVPLHLSSDGRDVNFESEDGQISYVVEPEYLKFNSDWNWLMEVVEKIEKLHVSNSVVMSNFTIINFHDLKKNEYKVFLGKQQFSNIPENRIENCYNAVVECVKWHNEQNC